MKTQFKELQKVYYADIKNHKVIKALWWNWSERYGDIEKDVINTNLSLLKTVKKTEYYRAEEKDLMRVDIKFLFKTKKEALLRLLKQ